MIPLMRFKRCEDAEIRHQLRWFHRHPDCSPDRDFYMYPDGYCYRYVEGECPVRPERVPELLKFCELELWFPSHFRLGIDPSNYADYCGNVALPLKDWFFSKMKRLTFTPVAACHGDLTLENVVWTGERFVFLDPGFDRGLPCRELDEAKIMQSLEEHLFSTEVLPLMHWEPAHWLAEKLKSFPHRVLLASHYLRLLRHAAKHPEWRVKHARRRLEELTQ